MTRATVSTVHVLMQQQLRTVTSCCVTVNSVSRRPGRCPAAVCHLTSWCWRLGSGGTETTIYCVLDHFHRRIWLTNPSSLRKLGPSLSCHSPLAKKMALDGLWRDNEVRLYDCKRLKVSFSAKQFEIQKRFCCCHTQPSHNPCDLTCG